MRTSPRAHELRLQQLAACMSATFALGAAAMPGQAHGISQAGLSAGIAYRVGALLQAATASAILTVSSCADDGSTGTLRQVMGISGDGDTINLSGLLCSPITLISGEIATTRNGLLLQGPTDRTLTITTPTRYSPPYNRLLHHTGIGNFHIDHLTLSNGKYASSTGDAVGGCVNSSGGVILSSSVVTGCTVSVTTTGISAYYAAGGAIYAKGFIQMSHSQITGNTALASNNSNTALGGGLASRGGVYAYYSAVSGNSALGVTVGSSVGKGGAAVVGGIVRLTSSTIDSNHADVAGALYQTGTPSDSVRIKNSTISGNRATGPIGGIAASSPLRIDNSTVAFNSANSNAAISVSANVVAYSSIIAKNLISISGVADLNIIGTGSTLSGSHNLIVSSNLSLPDTLTSDPRLVPLGDHGGPTRTHALVPLSPAVDHGNNLLALAFDQRGAGFSRAVGAAADIGAYERQTTDDEIFYDGVE